MNRKNFIGWLVALPAALVVAKEATANVPEPVRGTLGNSSQSPFPPICDDAELWDRRLEIADLHRRDSEHFWLKYNGDGRVPKHLEPAVYEHILLPYPPPPPTFVAGTDIPAFAPVYMKPQSLGSVEIFPCKPISQRVKESESAPDTEIQFRVLTQTKPLSELRKLYPPV